MLLIVKFYHVALTGTENNKSWATWYHGSFFLTYNPCRHAVRRKLPCIVAFVFGRESRPNFEIRFALSRPSCGPLHTFEVLDHICQYSHPRQNPTFGYTDLDSFDFQFQGCVFVGDDDGSRVLLQARERAHVANCSFDRILQGNSLVGTCRNDDDFSSLALSSAHIVNRSIDRNETQQRNTNLDNRLNPDRQCHHRHSIEISPEEPGVCPDRLVRQRLHSCPRRQAGARLIERDVSVCADSSEEKVDAADGSDFGFERGAFGLEIRGVTVEDVDVLAGDVDV